MDPDTYDIVFDGQLLDGFDRDDVSANLEKLFKSPATTIAKLMNGGTVVVKRNADLATARKYLLAMQKAGALAIIRPANSVSERRPAETAATPSPAPARAPAPASDPQQTNAATVTDESGEPSALSLAPAGSAVLREDERKVIQAAEVETDHIQLASIFATQQTSTAPPPPAPDTSHISVAEVGATLLEPAEPSSIPSPPDTSGIDLAEPGARIGPETLSIPLPEPDLSHIDLAPAGSSLEQIKDSRAPVNPDTSHLSIVSNQS